MLMDEIKRRVMDAMKAKRTLEKEILKVALGEMQTAEARGDTVDDAAAEKIIRKLVKSNDETLQNTSDPDAKKTLEQESEILRTLLPKSLTADEIVAALEPVSDAIKAASGDGQATGVAMKHLKSTGAVVDGKTVAQAVKKLRA